MSLFSLSLSVQIDIFLVVDLPLPLILLIVGLLFSVSLPWTTLMLTLPKCFSSFTSAHSLLLMGLVPFHPVHLPS